MNMPSILECQVTKCAYNHAMKCRALAITVGDAERARCDTFIPHSSKAGDPTASGGVGACKMDSCVYNRQLECTAPGIEVGPSNGSAADCLTYAKEPVSARTGF